MFEKLVKLQMIQNCGLYIGTCTAAAMGMLWTGKVLTGFPPYDTFEFAPSIFFLVVAALVWTKVLYDLMNRSFRTPESTLMMTLPVSEETHVQSKVYVGTLAGFVLMMLLGIIVLYWGTLDGDMQTQLTALTSMYVDLTYPAWVAAVSIGLVPVLAVLSQLFFCSLLLRVTLQLRGSAGLQKCTVAVYLLLMALQIGCMAWLIVNYEVFIGRIHPLVIAVVLMVVYLLGALVCYKGSVKHLKQKYQD